MATEKRINSRIVHKHDFEANWNKAVTFIPKQGEIIVYDVDDKNTTERFKIGDGVTSIVSLPFYLEDITSDIQTQLNNKSQVQIITWGADD